VLGKTPLLRTLGPNRSIDKGFEDVFNPMVGKQMRLLRIHCYGFHVGIQTLRIEPCSWMCPQRRSHRFASAHFATQPETQFA
jgi:hypothetical protein